ncbi:hypothetical protein [Flavobacterium covae]|uniref:hypothetical protein n=1 Tax=Flavobacterium covae TaxID=2906076 RepID=UPI0035E44F76
MTDENCIRNKSKWLIYYGYTASKSIVLDEEKSGLDKFLENAFRGNETLERFGELFWKRIDKLAENYIENNKKDDNKTNSNL